MSERQPYIQIDSNLWAVMRNATDRPAAMIVLLADRDNVPIYFVTTWHPEPGRRRVISQHDTLEEANASVLWDNSAAMQEARDSLPEILGYGRWAEPKSWSKQ